MAADRDGPAGFGRELILLMQALRAKFSPCRRFRKLPAAEASLEIKQTLYHYVETRGRSVAGWKCRSAGLLIFMRCWICSASNAPGQGIKGIFHTNAGWKSFNFNPEQFNYQTAEENIDNRLEIIYRQPREWLEFETQLMNCRADEGK